MSAKGHGYRFFFRSEYRRGRRWSHPSVLDRGPFTPLGDGFWVDAVALG